MAERTREWKTGNREWRMENRLTMRASAARCIILHSRFSIPGFPFSSVPSREPRRHRQTLLPQPTRGVQARAVAITAVAEHRDHRMTRAQRAGDVQRGGDVDAARAAEVQPFLFQ